MTDSLLREPPRDRAGDGDELMGRCRCGHALSYGLRDTASAPGRFASPWPDHRGPRSSGGPRWVSLAPARRAFHAEIPRRERTQGRREGRSPIGAADDRRSIARVDQGAFAVGF
jgi:hypothetical protein